MRNVINAAISNEFAGRNDSVVVAVVDVCRAVSAIFLRLHAKATGHVAASKCLKHLQAAAAGCAGYAEAMPWPASECLYPRTSPGGRNLRRQTSRISAA